MGAGFEPTDRRAHYSAGRNMGFDMIERLARPLTALAAKRLRQKPADTRLTGYGFAAVSAT